MIVELKYRFSGRSYASYGEATLTIEWFCRIQLYEPGQQKLNMEQNDGRTNECHAARELNLENFSNWKIAFPQETSFRSLPVVSRKQRCGLRMDPGVSAICVSPVGGYLRQTLVSSILILRNLRVDLPICILVNEMPIASTPTPTSSSF